MKRKWIYLVMLMTGFGAGFATCYAIYGLYTVEAPPPTDEDPPLKIALVTGPQTAKPYMKEDRADELDWEPYLIRPTLPPQVIERYHFEPQKAERNSMQVAPGSNPILRFVPIPDQGKPAQTHP